MHVLTYITLDYDLKRDLKTAMSNLWLGKFKIIPPSIHPSSGWFQTAAEGWAGGNPTNMKVS